MKKAKVSELKNKLSAYLKEVCQGEEIIISCHNETIAKLVTIQQKRLVVRKALIEGKFADVELKLPKLNKKINILKMLREDRDAR